MQSPTSNTIFLMRNISDRLQKSEQRKSDIPTSSLSEALARILAQSEMGKGLWEEKVGLSAMPLKLSDGSDLTFLSGKMLKESSSQNIAQIFGKSSKLLPTLGVIDSNGNCLIRHGFYPKTGNEYTLSDVLQKDVPQAYFLSCRKGASITRGGIAHFIPVHYSEQ